MGQAEGDAGIDENVAGLLCYLGIWVTGLIFFLTDKRSFVRFHAAQSMVVFGALHIIYIVLGHLLAAGSLVGGRMAFSMGSALFSILDLLGLALWIVLMIKAYQREKFKLPVAGDLAENLAGK